MCAKVRSGFCPAYQSYLSLMPHLDAFQLEGEHQAGGGQKGLASLHVQGVLHQAELQDVPNKIIARYY